MCELFGCISDRKIILNKELQEFYRHSEKHSHGWGIACWEKENENTYMLKGNEKATESQELRKVLQAGVEGKLVLGHIRFASVGKISKENSHPFQMKDHNNEQWTLIHNGTIFDGTELIKYHKYQKGETDSERILMYFIDQINGKINEVRRKLTIEEKGRVIEEAIASIADRNRLNLLFTDGKALFVHTNMENTLYIFRGKNYIMFATNPEGMEGIWEEVPLTTLLIYKDHHKVYRGKSHHKVYVSATICGEFDI